MNSVISSSECMVWHDKQLHCTATGSFISRNVTGLLLSNSVLPTQELPVQRQISANPNITTTRWPNNQEEHKLLQQAEKWQQSEVTKSTIKPGTVRGGDERRCLPQGRVIGRCAINKIEGMQHLSEFLTNPKVVTRKLAEITYWKLHLEIFSRSENVFVFQTCLSNSFCLWPGKWEKL